MPITVVRDFEFHQSFVLGVHACFRWLSAWHHGLREPVPLLLVLMLNWLFYRPIFGKKPERGEENPWQEYWGETYASELKQRLLKPLFDALDREGKIGDLIIDIGSGARPVSRLLEAKPGRMRICVDIAADNHASGAELRLRFDAEKVGQLAQLSYRKALVRACGFLGIDPRLDQETELAETIVLSDTLNYVDFQMVLSGFGHGPTNRFDEIGKDLSRSSISTGLVRLCGSRGALPRLRGRGERS